MVLSYTRSRAEGNLNSFDTFLGNFPTPLIRPDVYSNLPADLPNRFLMWGRVKVRYWSLQVLPIVEYRDGFPYSRFDEMQQYVGTPNGDSTRFPHFFSADARIMKDFKVSWSTAHTTRSPPGWSEKQPDTSARATSYTPK